MQDSREKYVSTFCLQVFFNIQDWFLRAEELFTVTWNIN